MKKYIYISILFITCIFSFGCKNKITDEEKIKLYLSAVDSYTDQKYEEATAYIKMLKKYDTGFYQADLLYGKINFFENNLPEASSTFQRLVKKYPQFIEARIWYIRTLIILGQNNLAQELLEKELSFNQTDWRIFYLYSLLEEKQGNIDKKIAMLNRAELALSDSTKVYLELSDVYGLLDLQDRANYYAEKAKLISNSNESLNFLQSVISK